MKIKIKRVVQNFYEGTTLAPAEGVLYEYNDFQFCICLVSNRWCSIELQTGHAAGFYDRKEGDTDEFCIKYLKKAMTQKDKSQYIAAIKKIKRMLINHGFSLPINQMIVDENSN